MRKLLKFFTNSIEKSEKINTINAWYLLIMLTPFFSAFLILLINGQGLDLKILIPVWNDEVDWFNQVQSVITYSRPLGYDGFNGTHAQIGTFGTWGISPLLPYALFGKIFGWNLYSRTLANLFFLSISLFLFCLLTQPNWREMIWITVLYFFSFITVGYSLTSMCEGLRYSLAIVLTGIVIFLSRKTEADTDYCKKHIFMLVCFALFILFAINVYIILALFIPLLCKAIFNRKALHIRIIISFFATSLIAFAENKMITLVSAPSYLISAITIYINELKENGLYSMIVCMINNAFNNLKTIDPPSILQSNDHTLFWYFIIYLIILAVSIYNFMHTGSEGDFICVYILTGFLLGYCVLYTGSAWTLCRGTNTGLICTFMLLSVTESKLGSSADLRKLSVLLFIIAIIGIKEYHSNLIDERAEISAHKDEILREKEILSEIMDISENNDRWGNTIATYGFCDPFWQLALPNGAGTNFMINGEANTEARYVLVNSKEDNMNEIVNLNIDTGHSVLYQDEIFVIMEKEH